jgi:titin
VNGLVIQAQGSTIRGLVINRFEGNGVLLSGSGATGNQIVGNFIGTNAAGTADRGNSNDGVEISAGADDNTVGGTTAPARNLISSNSGDGVQIIGGLLATGNEVLGNFIGTNVTGNAALGNSGDGVEIFDTEVNTIGGTTAAARNVISGNFGDGVVLQNDGATGNKVQGNFIGTGANGITALGNDDGVAISSGSDNTIGSAVGTTAGGNTIANNDQDGVLVFGGAAVGNSILSNSIYSNGETGIDLGGGTQDEFEVTANDTDDPDATTPDSNNHRQNFPEIISATRSIQTGFTTITGTLNSNPNQTYTVQCFLAAPDPFSRFAVTPDPSGHGEGVFPIGEDRTVTTDAGGDADGTDSFRCVSPIPQAGQTVTATATNTSGTASGTSIGDTSEFSENETIAAVP